MEYTDPRRHVAVDCDLEHLLVYHGSHSFLKTDFPFQTIRIFDVLILTGSFTQMLFNSSQGADSNCGVCSLSLVRTSSQVGI